MKPVLAAITLLVFSASVHGQGQSPSASIVGHWKSAPFELELVSDLHRSVYGPNARSVRTAEVTIRPSGEGTFTVTNLVRDRRGVVVPGTRSVEELSFTLGASESAPGDRTRYTASVVKAERKYLDEPAGTFPLTGAGLEVYLPVDGKGPLEIRYDTPEGSGSFWETLRRLAARAPTRSTAAPTTR